MRREVSVVVASVVVLVTGGVAHGGHPQGTIPFRVKADPGPDGDGRSTTTLFVHGVNKNAASNCGPTFGAMHERLRDFGHTGTFINLGYYRGDSCDHSIQHHGRHGRHHGSGHRNGGHTADTDIRHLGYHLAKYIWSHHTEKGEEVQLVVHSMGGLITRYALAQVERGARGFPPYLQVQDVVTLGTPHLGGNFIHDRLTDYFCPHTRLQCRQMNPRKTAGKRFLVWLHRNAKHPDPFGFQHTDWTTIASYNDEAVTVHSGTGMAADHKVAYWGGISNRPNHHSDYMNDTADFRDAGVYWRDGSYHSWEDAPHVVRWTDFALYHLRW